MSKVARKPHREMDWNGVRQRLAQMSARTDQAAGLSPERTKEILDKQANAIGPALAHADHAAARIDVLTLSLASERYAIETLYAREVGPVASVTPVPGTPEFIRGVANLRGEIIAIVDLGCLFGMESQGQTDLTRIIILGTRHAELAILADAVHEVISLPIDGLLHLDTTKTRIDRAYLRAVTSDALIVLDGAALIDDHRLIVQHGGGSPVASPNGRTL